MYSQPMPALNKPKPKKNPSHAAARFPFAWCHSQNSAASEKITRGNSEKGAKPRTVSKPRQKAIMNLNVEVNFTENYHWIDLANYMASPILFIIARGNLEFNLKMQGAIFMSIAKSLKEGSE